MAKLSHRISIGAPREQVFEALSTKDGLQGWYTPHVEGEAGDGGVVTLGFTNQQPFRWRFVQLSPGEVVRWECVEGPGQSKGTTARFELSDHADGRTIVHLDHEGFNESDEALRSCNTLWGVLMHHLRDFSETGFKKPAHQ